jgi:hypothetical protein
MSNAVSYIDPASRRHQAVAMTAAQATSDRELAELELSRGQLTSQSIDLHGVRLGDLVAEVIVDTSAQCGHVWRFRCLGCGGTVLLPAARARQRFVTWGARLACNHCMAEEGRTSRQDVAISIYRDFWDLYRDLYGTTWGQRVGKLVLEALCDEFGPVREEHPPDATLGLDVESAFAKGPQQLAAYLYPIDVGPDRILRCVNCETDHSQVFGCVLCCEAVCGACVRAERHCCCPEDHFAQDGPTLMAVGRAMSMSRERARQLQEQALGTIRKQLVTEDDDLRRSQDRERIHAVKNPLRCLCGQRLGGGVYCSRGCEREAQRRQKEAEEAEAAAEAESSEKPRAPETARSMLHAQEPDHRSRLLQRLLRMEEPCPCESGKTFDNCHGAASDDPAPAP